MLAARAPPTAYTRPQHTPRVANGRQRAAVVTAAAERPSAKRSAARRRRSPLLPPLPQPASPVQPTDQPIPMPPGYAGASGVGEQPIPGMMALPGIAGAGGSASAAAASSRQASQAEPQVDWEAARNEQLWQQVEAAVAAAEEQERDGRVAEAVEGAQAALQALEAQHGSAPLPLVVLRQLLWDLLFALERHGDALRQVAAAHHVVAARYGKDSPEAAMLAVRLGMSIAACGRMEEGLTMLYDATPVVQQALEALVAQLADAQTAGGALPEEQAVALQDGIDRLGAALGEGNYYGAVLTMRHAAAAERLDGVVRGWEELDEILTSGYATLMAAAGGMGGGSGAGGPSHALREHDRLVRELGGHELLARLLAAQSARLHDMAAQGLDHPAFM